jgi:3-oxoacyl-[acyl-carrier protein] reductase
LENSLKNKTILITGGTSELGQPLVRKALQHGARVFFTYFVDEETAKQLELLGAHGATVDLASTQAMDEFVAGFQKKTECLDILIHNAATTADAMIEKMSEQQWDKVMNVNLKAPFYLTRQLLSLLLRAPQAKIFTLVSQAGLNGLAGAANYAASKGGLIAMTKTLARELGRKKILVNAVNPGFMRSSMTESVPEEVLRQNRERSPLKSFTDPEEVADFLMYLSSDMMSRVTGQVFHFESRPF